MTKTGLTCLLVSVLIGGLAGSLDAQDPDQAGAIFDRAVRDFENGSVREAAEGFDTVVRLVPNAAPQLWQRGIALYYAERYQDCREQFESHRTVNPDDVENAAWHFLCVARLESPEAARAALLPVGPDPRTPMSEVYEMFRGAMTPEQVLNAAGDGATARFYAHLYLGLYFEAHGDEAQAREHIVEAASDRFMLAGGYMYMVARVHRDIRNWPAPSRED